MRKAMLTFFAMGCFIAHPALASEHRLSKMSVGGFLRICNDSGKNALCDAYLAGVADGGALTYLSSVNRTGEGEAAFCIPSDEKTSAMRNKVVRWILNQQRQKSNLSGPVGKTVVAALHDAYPCNDARNGAAP